MATEQTTSPRCERCSLLRLLRNSTRTPRPRRPITLAHCHAPVPAAAPVSSSSRDSRPAVSPSTDPVRPHRPVGSTHHDDANATQPTQHHPSLLAAPGRPRWSLPKCWKSAPIIHPTSASKTHLPACDRPKLSSCHSSSMVLVPTRTISRAVNRHQISIDRPAAASLPSATSCIAGLPTPADAGCGCGSPRPASANLYTNGSFIGAIGMSVNPYTTDTLVAARKRSTRLGDWPSDQNETRWARRRCAIAQSQQSWR